MGFYTTIVAENGGRYQIKTGVFDKYAVYAIGDEVPQAIDEKMATYGGIFDGVYHGVHEPFQEAARLPELWIVIKDRKVLKSQGFQYDGRYKITGGLEVQRAALEKRYGIEPPDPKLWNEAAWANYGRLRVELAREKLAKEIEAHRL